MKPMEIEKRSFEIIAEELGDRKIDPEFDLVVKRVIHTTADFDYYDNMAFSEHAVQKMMEAIKKGVDPKEAYEKNIGTYGRYADAAKVIDPRNE